MRTWIRDKRVQILVILIVLFILIAITRQAQAATVSNTKNIQITRLQLLASHAIRSDAAGDGKYLSSRGARKHAGVDLLATPGQAVTLPVAGKVIKIGQAYATDANYNSYHIELANKLVLKLLYVKPLYKVGASIQAGAKIATAQNIAAKYPSSGMLNHIHVEILSNGKNIDPTPFLI